MSPKLVPNLASPFRLNEQQLLARWVPAFPAQGMGGGLGTGVISLCTPYVVSPVLSW